MVLLCVWLWNAVHYELFLMVIELSNVCVVVGGTSMLL